MPEKRKMISKDHAKMSVVEQCHALNIHRSGLYYESRGESELNLELMLLMDKKYQIHPFMGAARMHIWLTMDKGYNVNIKRIERLYYKIMGLRALMPGIHTTKRNKDHKTYPYLLRNLIIERPNQVWATDITYVPMQTGFMYLVAVIDLYSRKILSWSLSNTMDAQWCKDTMEEAIKNYGKPAIINTDQGSQFTSEVFTTLVLTNEIKLSMDGKGRAIDNVFIERFWRSIKYESIYLNPPNNGHDLYIQIKEYLSFYNIERRHQGIDNEIPEEKHNQNLKYAA